MDCIIDTDPGLDDVLTIIYAMTNPNVNIKALTVVHGNTSVRNTSKNTYLTLDVLSMSDHHQIYSKPSIAIGAEKPIIGRSVFAEKVHGNDGMLS